MVSTKTEPTPPEAVVESFPRRLTLEAGFETYDGPAVVSQEVVGPREKRPSLVMLWVQDRGFEEAFARLIVLSRLEKSGAMGEARLGAHAATERLEQARGRGELHHRGGGHPPVRVVRFAAARPRPLGRAGGTDPLAPGDIATIETQCPRRSVRVFNGAICFTRCVG